MSDIDYEKNQYAVGNAESPDHGIKSIVAEKGNNIGEATDIYGDVGLWSSYIDASMLTLKRRSALLKSMATSSGA
jgi:hypothetical protein